MKEQSGTSWPWAVGCLFVLFVAIFTFLFFVPSVVRSVVSSDMTPQEYAAMRTFLDQPLTFPEDWQVVPPFSEELLHALDQLHHALESCRIPPPGDNGDISSEDLKESQVFQVLRTGQRLGAEEEALARQISASAEIFLSAASSLAAVSHYEAEALFSLSAFHQEIGDLQVGAMWLHTRAFLQAAEEDWLGAFDTLLTTLKMARRHPASRITTHLFAHWLDLSTTLYIASLADRCPDSTVLRNVLRQMNELDPSIHLDCLRDPFAVESIGMLRAYARQGLGVDLTPGKGGGYYLRQYYKAAELGEDAGDVPLPDQVTKVDFFPDEWFYDLAYLDVSVATVRERYAKAQYDIARLFLDSRIAELESGVPGTEKAPFVPEFFPDPLVDPFTGEAFLWDQSTGSFYSPGPDKTDDRNLIRYSPSNGASSAGDISLP